MKRQLPCGITQVTQFYLPPNTGKCGPLEPQSIYLPGKDRGLSWP